MNWGIKFMANNKSLIRFSLISTSWKKITGGFYCKLKRCYLTCIAGGLLKDCPTNKWRHLAWAATFSTLVSSSREVLSVTWMQNLFTEISTPGTEEACAAGAIISCGTGTILCVNFSSETVSRHALRTCLSR